MTITTSGSNPTTVEATSDTTTTSPANALQDINDSIVGIVDSGVTVDGFGLAIESSQGTLNPGSTIQVTNNGTVSTNQNSNAALTIGAAGPVVPPGTFGDFSYTGSGNITDTGSGAEALSISDPTGNVTVTVSATSTIAGSTTGAGIEASSGLTASSTGTVKVTVDAGGKVEGETAVSFGNGVATLDNSGIVQGTGSLSSGVGGQAATVTNSGTISGTAIGVGVENVTLTNKTGATIETANTTAAEAALAAIAAVEALGAADITNQLGATIQATGPLGQVGILVGQAGATGAATVHNDGIISAVGNGINTNTSGLTTIINSGTISNTTGGGATPGDIRVNVASITNSATGAITGADFGILFRNSQTTGSTIFNAGTISGTTAAIQFSSASSGNTLTLAPGFTITGNVTQGAGNILQLGGSSGTGAFDVSTIGTQYQNFTTFNKIDSSTWTLTGTGTDGWTVEQGTLQVDGTIGAATVQSGGTLDGTGATGALTVESGGTLAPGDDPGTITTGDLDLQSGSTLSAEIEGTSPGVGGFDQVDVNGSVTLGGMLSFSLLNGFTPATGDTFELINNDGNDAVNGTFAGLAEGATFTQGGITYSISYMGGTGNDVVLTVGNAPVPPDQPPVVTLGGTLGSYTENAAAPPIAPAASVTDVDSPNFNGGSLTASSSGLPEDQLSILTDATVTVAGGVVSVGGGEIGTINVANNGVNGASLEIDFDSTSATPAAVSTLLQHIAYADSSDDPSTTPRTVTFSVNDGGSTANGGNPIGTASATFGVTATNDAPTVSAPSSYTPSAAITIGGITFGDVDADGGSELATFISSSGTFMVSAAGQALGATGNGTNTVTLLNSVANLNAFIANGDLVLNGAATGATVTFSIDDEGHTGQGPAGGITTMTTANVLSGPALTAGAPVTGTEGSSTGTVKLATFTDASISNPMVGNFMATIDWGDGTAPSTGTVAAEGGGVFDVSGSHTYTEENSYTIHVSVNDGSNTGATTDGATIADAPLTAAGQAISGTGGTAINNAAVATFTDANPNGMVGDFSATIDWGDGTVSAGTVVAANGGFAVDGSHTYQNRGSFTTAVTITDDGGSHDQVNGSASIAPFLPNNPPPPPGTAANMVTVRGLDGTYEIYDFGNNMELAAHPLTQIAPPFQAVGLGSFNGTDTTDLAVRNGTAFQFDDVANNNVTKTGVMGMVGTEWSVVGLGKFDESSFTDMMMEKTSGAVDTYDAFVVRNNQFVESDQIAVVGSEWQAVGFGDVNGDGSTDMVLRNSQNGTLEFYDTVNRQVSSTGVLGAVGSEWQAVGFGNFDNSGFSDLIMRDSNNGAFDLFVIRNNQIVGAHQITTAASEWQLAGVADLNGDGTDDMLLRNSNIGAFEYYDVANGQVTGQGGLGQSGLEWTVVGLTNSPATAGASTATDGGQTSTMQTAAGGRDAWLTQAMQTGGAANQPLPAGMGLGTGALPAAGTSSVSGPGFDAGSDLPAGAAPAASLTTPNPLQTHAV